MTSTKFSILLTLLTVGALAGLQSCKDLGHAPARPSLVASTFSVTLNPGGQATVVISGGTPPYSIVRQPNPALATASLTNNQNRTADLQINAASGNVSGTTSVKIKDSDTHTVPTDGPLHEENEIEIEIRITPSTTTVSFANQIQPIFTASCVNPGCHPGGGAPFPLTAGQSYSRLVNQDATTGPCVGNKRVLPGDPANSALIKRLEGNCGSLMPLGGAALPSASIQLMRDWIAQGAQNN